MSRPAVLADAMLGQLARWLRALDFDTAYDATLPDRALVRLAESEGRILLTRDRHLLRELRPVRALEIRRDAALDQLRDVVLTLGLTPPPESFTRCLLCNVPLETVARSPAEADASGIAVPAGARALHGPVRRCRCCGRTYWQGSHVRRMRLALERALPGWGGASTEGEAADE